MSTFMKRLPERRTGAGYKPDRGASTADLLNLGPKTKEIIENTTISSSGARFGTRGMSQGSFWRPGSVCGRPRASQRAYKQLELGAVRYDLSRRRSGYHPTFIGA